MSRPRKLIDRLTRMHRVIVWAVQIGIFALSGVGAFLLRFDLTLRTPYLRYLVWAVPIWIVVKSVVFRVAELDRGWWRYVSVGDAVRIGLGNLAGSALSCGAILWLAPAGFPRSIYLLDLMVCFLATAGVRVMVRLTAEATAQGRQGGAEKNTLIYGAGAAGIALLLEIRRNPKLPYRVLGFLDDQP